MAPSVTNPSQNQPSDHTGLLIGSTMAATTQVVNSTLDRLLNVAHSPQTGICDIDKALEQIRKDLDTLTSAQSSEQEDIKRLLEDALNKEILQHLSNQIEKQIDVCIDDTVKKLVEEELDKYVPREIRNKVDEQRAELLSLQVQIHNSEAKRLNGLIKTHKHFNETLQSLLDERGHRCDIFPRTVNELRGYDDAKVLRLVQFFGMENPDRESSTRNLNWFLRTIGITYQPDFRA